MSQRCAILFLFTVSLCGCVKPVTGVITSDERRIWVVRSGEEVYRCADGGGPEQPPKPICVRAPMTGSSE